MPTQYTEAGFVDAPAPTETIGATAPSNATTADARPSFHTRDRSGIRRNAVAPAMHTAHHQERALPRPNRGDLVKPSCNAGSDR